MARGPFIKWEQVIRDIVDLLGVNKPTTTRREHVAEAVGLKVSSCDILLRQLREMGALEVRAVAGGFRPPQKPGGKSTPIRNQEYTITKSADDILFIGKKRNIKWGQPEPIRQQRADEARAFKPRLETVAPTTTPVRPEYKAEMDGLTGNPAVEEPVAAVGEESDANPFAVLKPLKRNEAQALIESARQYQGRMEFINEEIQRFADHGITLDPAVIGFPRDERLEIIGLVIDYVTRVENENARLQAYASERGRDVDEERELRLKLQRQENEVGRLIRERAEQQEAVTAMHNRWSGKEATYKERIRDLEQKVLDLSRRNGAQPTTAAVVRS